MCRSLSITDIRARHQRTRDGDLGDGGVRSKSSSVSWPSDEHRASWVQRLIELDEIAAVGPWPFNLECHPVVNLLVHLQRDVLVPADDEGQKAGRSATRLLIATTRRLVAHYTVA